jgi:hypothetical protein
VAVGDGATAVGVGAPRLQASKATTPAINKTNVCLRLEFIDAQLCMRQAKASCRAMKSTGHVEKICAR